MRAAMGAFATGVTVVCGVDGDGPVGFACQSFASVSLDPPLVLFCADHRGRAWPRMRDSGLFNVHVLGAEQDALCTRFGSRGGRKFDGLEWRYSRWSTPVIDGVLLRVHCAVYDVHVAGDHDVVIGEVLAIDEPEANSQPMIFYRGDFELVKRSEPSLPVLWDWGDHWG